MDRIYVNVGQKLELCYPDNHRSTIYPYQDDIIAIPSNVIEVYLDGILKYKRDDLNIKPIDIQSLNNGSRVLQLAEQLYIQNPFSDPKECINRAKEFYDTWDAQ